MRVPIRVGNIYEMPDGIGKMDIEFDEDVKSILMMAWGIDEWDEDRASEEFTKVIRDSLNDSKGKYCVKD